MNSYLQLFVNGIRPGSKTPGNCTVVALTSATPREGVSYVTESFAVELARRTGKRTLVVSAADLQRVEMLHFNQVSKFCSPTNVSNLYFFSPDEKTAGSAPVDRPLLKKRTNEWEQGVENLQTLRFVFDYVMLDCPALISSDIASLFAPAVDGLVVVVEAERTRKEQVRKALSTIAAANGNLLGCVLNKRRYAVPRWIYSRI